MRVSRTRRVLLTTPLHPLSDFSVGAAVVCVPHCAADMLKEEKTGGKKFMDFGGEILPYAAANNIKVRHPLSSDLKKSEHASNKEMAMAGKLTSLI